MAFEAQRAHSFGFNAKHAVQFYEDDAFLQRTVAEYLAAGLRVGQPAVVIATEAHRAGFSDELRLRGLDPDTLVREERLTFLDARRTLSTLMVGAMPDPDRCAAEIDRVITRVAQRSGTQAVRAYGEMVDLLWRGGNGHAAIALEELWNEAADRHALTLLCAYAMPSFKASDSESFHQICRTHSHVFPAESFGAVRGEEARNREIARLQQRAGALEAEIEQRHQLEASLREKTAELDHLRSLFDEAWRADAH